MFFDRFSSCFLHALPAPGDRFTEPWANSQAGHPAPELSELCFCKALGDTKATRRRLGNCYEQHRRVPALLLHDHEAILVFVVQQLRLVLGTRDHFMIISCQAAKYEISGGNHDCRHFLSPLKLPLTSTAWCLASSCFIISS